MRRVPWLMIVAVALVALLGALATLQYRWLGDVSQAERERNLQRTEPARACCR